MWLTKWWHFVILLVIGYGLGEFLKWVDVL